MLVEPLVEGCEKKPESLACFAITVRSDVRVVLRMRTCARRAERGVGKIKEGGLQKG